MSFHRARYLPRGGPDGGDGGRGGDFYLEARSELTTLDCIGGARRFAAQVGQPGRSKKMHGRNGDDLVLALPPGTIVRDPERGNVLAELATPGERVLLLRGGRGGRGNHSFRSARRQAPRIAQDGGAAEVRRVRLELRLLADVGLLGLPSAGKSTFLRAVSSAHPEVAEYPFTTLRPKVGIVERDFQSRTLADLPGLVEGAHEGRGLGLRFLRHVERTRALAHLVDASGGELDELLSDYQVVRDEVVAYGHGLDRRPTLVLLTKLDLRESPLPLSEFQHRVGLPVLPVCSVDGRGLENVVRALFQITERVA